MACKNRTIPKVAKKTAHTAHKRAARRAAEYRKACRRVVYVNLKIAALGLIDVLRAFMAGGGLGVPGAEKILKAIFRALEYFGDSVFAVMDRHPYGHIGYASSYIGFKPGTELTYAMVRGWTLRNHRIAPHAKFTLRQLKAYLKRQPNQSQTLWSDHAGDGTPDAEFHPSIIAAKIKFFHTQVKGMDPACDSYSAFFDNLERPTGLDLVLRKRGIRELFLPGLVFQFCLGWTAEGAAKLGYKVYVLMDGTVSLKGIPGHSAPAMRRKLRQAGVLMIHSRQLRRMPAPAVAAMKQAA